MTRNQLVASGCCCDTPTGLLLQVAHELSDDRFHQGTRTLGCLEVAVTVDRIGAEVIATHEALHEPLQGLDLGRGGALYVSTAQEIAEHADADVLDVVGVADVGTLPAHLASLPDSARGIDQEVIADVAVAAVLHVILLDPPDLRCARRLLRVAEVHGRVMNREAFWRPHGLEVVAVGGTGGTR